MTMKPSQLALGLSLAVAACHAEPDRADATAQAASSPVMAPSTTAATLDSATPLAVGSTAPDFTVEAWLAGKTQPFRLAEALKSGPVVLYFFPAAFTPGCNIEARLFSQACLLYTSDAADE